MLSVCFCALTERDGTNFSRLHRSSIDTSRNGYALYKRGLLVRQNASMGKESCTIVLLGDILIGVQGLAMEEEKLSQ